MSDNACWLCLDESTEANPCLAHCACSNRTSHSTCLQRWALQSAGTMEETQCRFCSAPYSTGWRTMPNTASIFSRPSSPSKPTPAAATLPRIKVNGPDGKHIMLPLRPGEEGKRQFETEVRAFLKLGQEAKININFDVKAPSSLTSGSNGGGGSSSSHPAPSSEIVRLDGLKTYDAPFHCASLAAEERRTSFTANTTTNNTNTMSSAQKTMHSSLASSAPSFSQKKSVGSQGGGSGGGNDIGRSRVQDQGKATKGPQALPPKPQANPLPKGGKSKSLVSKVMDLFKTKDQAKTKGWVYHQSPQTF